MQCWQLAKSRGVRQNIEKIKATKKNTERCTRQNSAKACQLTHTGRGGISQKTYFIGGIKN